MKQLVSKLALAGATASSLFWGIAAHAQGVGSGDAPEAPSLTIVDSVSIMSIIQSVINALLMIAGGLAVAFLIYAGIMYIIGGAKGDADAKKSIINALTGVVIIVLSYVLVNLVMDFIGTGANALR